ncbi:MAG: phosphatase PAP2 family protein [Saprospiraceae bacterium]
MKTLQRTTIKGILGLIVILFVFKICYSQPLILTTPKTKLTPLAPVQHHYKTLGKLSVEPNENERETDVIRFPNKKYQLLIRLFKPAYLTRKQLKALTNEIQPPANSSAQTKAELEFLLDLQEKRTVEQEKMALDWNSIVYVPVPTMKGDEDLFFEGQYIMGDNCTAENYPATKTILKNIMKEMRIMEFTAKNHFLRARPRQLSKSLKPLVEMNTPSFASGHTLWAYLQAYIWAELIPQKRTEFLDLAYEIGFSREILGVHYPSDEEAARQLSYKMLDLMWKTEKFQKHLEAAKAEWE